MKHKKFVVIGDVDAGKTSLCAALLNKQERITKTQQVEHVNKHIMDVPGEYTSIPHMRMALLSTLQQADAIIYVEPCDGSSKHAQPNDMLKSLENKTLIGVISKIDVSNANIPAAKQELQRLGIVSNIFEISIHQEETIENLRKWLLDQGFLSPESEC